jgi:hypothetical protein
LTNNTRRIRSSISSPTSKGNVISSNTQNKSKIGKSTRSRNVMNPIEPSLNSEILNKISCKNEKDNKLGTNAQLNTNFNSQNYSNDQTATHLNLPQNDLGCRIEGEVTDFETFRQEEKNKNSTIDKTIPESLGVNRLEIQSKGDLTNIENEEKQAIKIDTQSKLNKNKNLDLDFLP